MRDRFIIGLMSGTSVDAIDAALVCVSVVRGHYSAKVVHHVEHPWSAAVRKRLLGVMAPAKTTTEEICQLNFLVAEHSAVAVERVLEGAKTPRDKITAIGSHGQTICHLPPPPSASGMQARRLNKGATLQLGDASVLATLTGITTVGNFRPADMVLGGQGAPLVPFADAVLFTHPTKTRAVQNIGGIANVTYLPPTGRPRATAKIFAFDTGPGNMLLDAVVSLASDGKRRYDEGGRLAAKGSLDMRLFRELQSHPYFTRKPPKSTGREEFGQQFLDRYKNENGGERKLKIENILHTLTRLTAWSIADAYLQFLPGIPDEVILCGGGADNPVLVRMLTEEFAAVGSPIVKRIDDFGIPNKAKEAASFALLAVATLDGVAGNVPSVTGAVRPTILGVIAPQAERHAGMPAK